MALVYTANYYGRVQSGPTPTDACNAAAAPYYIHAVSASDGVCSMSDGTGLSFTVSGTADPVAPPVTPPASAPVSSASASSGSTVVCGAACTVTVQHEIVFPPGDAAVAGMNAGSVVEVLGWGLGFVLLMYVFGMAAGAAVGLIRKI